MELRPLYLPLAASYPVGGAVYILSPRRLVSVAYAIAGLVLNRGMAHGLCTLWI